MLDRSSPLPLYFQLRTLLLEQIEGRSQAWRYHPNRTRADR